MVLTDRQQKLLRWIGYPALAIITFIYAAWLTFPADKLEERLMAALGDKAEVTMDDFSLSWIPGTVTASNVVIRTEAEDKDEQPREIVIDELDVGIGLLSLLTGTLSVDVRAESGDGVIEGTFKKSGDDLYLSAETEEMPIKMMPGLNVAFAGLPANQGTLDAKIRLELPEGKWEQANGELELACAQCSVGPGKVKPTARPGRTLNAFKAQGITLPELQLGDAIVVMEIVEGRGLLQQFETNSTDGELLAEGYMDFKDPMGQSELNFCARFKFSDEVKQKNPKLAAMETGLEKARRDDGYIGMRLSRTVERPRRKGSRDCEPGKEPNSRRPDRSRTRPTAARTAPKPALPPSAGSTSPSTLINRDRDRGSGREDGDGDDEDDVDARMPSIPPPSTAPARMITPEAAARLGRGMVNARDDEEDRDEDVGEGRRDDEGDDDDVIDEGEGDYDEDDRDTDEDLGDDGEDADEPMDEGGDYDDAVIQ